MLLWGRGGRGVTQGSVALGKGVEESHKVVLLWGRGVEESHKVVLLWGRGVEESHKVVLLWGKGGRGVTQGSVALGKEG